MPSQTSKNIAWVEAGNPTKGTVIFLHSMAGSATAWAPQVTALSHDYRCIAWDMPGYGDSTDAPEGADMTWIVDTLANFVIDTLGLKSAHFVGLSVGGMILQHFAAAHPTLTQSISILDSSPKFGYGADANPSEFVDPILAGFASGTTVKTFSDSMVRAIVGPNCPEDVKVSTIASMSRARINGLTLVTHLIAAHDAVDKLASITCPTLTIAGIQDAETPPAYSHAIANRISGANVSIIPNAGHLVNSENPGAVTARLRFFLEHAF